VFIVFIEFCKINNFLCVLLLFKTINDKRDNEQEKKEERETSSS